MKKLIALVFVGLLVFGITGCQKEEKKVVIASKPMTEQFIIAEMLTLLIEENTDIKVEQNQGIGGGTSNIHPGMISGEFDIYPEYTGTGWLFVLKEDLIRDPMELYKQVKESYSSEYDIKWLDLYGFNDTYGIAMKREVAKEMGIETYSDLAQRASELKLGANFDFYEREDGFPGLKEEYGFEFKENVEVDIALKYNAIADNEVDVIIVFSTDGRLSEYDLKVLEDDKNFFPSYYATTLIRNETLLKYPELEDVLNKLSNQISDEEMTYMNYLVEIEKEDPKDVARDFLKEKGIIK